MDNSSGSDNAKRIMEQLHKSQVDEQSKLSEVKDKNFMADSSKNDSAKGTDGTLDNLIHMAHKSNREIPEGGRINIKPNTYDRIMVILKDGGMDSMSQQKSLTAIKEILNECQVEEEVIEKEVHS